MSAEFEKLKQERDAAFDKLRASIQPKMGSHKSTRLAQAGCRDTRSLLNDKVALSHAQVLRNDLWNMCQKDGERSQNDLRFITILHSVTPQLCDEALNEAIHLKQKLHAALSETGIRCLGAVEFEIVNLSLFRKIKSRSTGENRKLDVLEKLGGQSLETGALVHFHGILDFRGSRVDSEHLRRRLQGAEDWRRSTYQVEIKQLYESKPLRENLHQIAAYLTKGGNETLRYNLGFGRDPDSQLDAQIWRGPSGRADHGAESVPDERGMTIGEIQLLDQLWLRLMKTRDDDRGYIVDLR